MERMIVRLLFKFAFALMAHLESYRTSLLSICRDANVFYQRFGSSQLLDIVQDLHLLNEIIAQVIKDQSIINRPLLELSQNVNTSAVQHTKEGTPKVWDQHETTTSIKKSQQKENKSRNYALTQHKQLFSKCQEISSKVNLIKEKIVKKVDKKSQLSESSQPIEFFQSRQVENILNMLTTTINYLMILQPDTKKTVQSISHTDQCRQDSKEGGSQSAKRSLLTQKIRKRTLNVGFDQYEDGIEHIDGRIIVESTFLMNEIKQMSKQNATEPLPKFINESGLTFSENSCIVTGYYSKNQGKQITQTKTVKKELLGEMRMDLKKQKQKRSKKQSSGCSRCDIY